MSIRRSAQGDKDEGFKTLKHKAFVTDTLVRKISPLALLGRNDKRKPPTVILRSEATKDLALNGKCKM